MTGADGSSRPTRSGAPPVAGSLMVQAGRRGGAGDLRALFSPSALNAIENYWNWEIQKEDTGLTATAGGLYQQRPALTVSLISRFAGRSALDIPALGQTLLVALPAREEERQFVARKVVVDENDDRITRLGWISC